MSQYTSLYISFSSDHILFLTIVYIALGRFRHRNFDFVTFRCLASPFWLVLGIGIFVSCFSDALPRCFGLIQASEFLFLPFPMLYHITFGHFRHRDFDFFTFRCSDAFLGQVHGIGILISSFSDAKAHLYNIVLIDPVLHRLPSSFPCPGTRPPAGS